MTQPILGTPSGSRIDLGHLFGIPIRLHRWWFVIPLLFFVTNPTVGTVVFVLALYGVVLLHELGHALVARRYGVRVIDITLWPLGGMANMASIPEVPKTEAVIAIAGPAVNLVLAIPSAIAFMLLQMAGLQVGAYIAAQFLMINVVLGVFNLLPAFPMDGGRILRAWYASRRDWVAATELAVRHGRFVLIVATLVLTFGFGNFMAPILAAYLWMAGGQELWAVRMRHGQNPLGEMFARAFGGRPGAPGDPGDAQPWPPGATHGSAPDPTAPAPRAEGRSHGRGFTDEEIAEIERFRGRLGR